MADNEMVTNAHDEADEAEAKSKESVKAAVAGLCKSMLYLPN